MSEVATVLAKHATYSEIKWFFQETTEAIELILTT